MATKQTKTVATSPPPSTYVGENTYDWSQEQATGFENTSQDDLGIPFLMIIQKGSPQVDDSSPDFAVKGIPDAHPGDIINTLSNTVLPRPVEFVPCGYDKLYVEWKPRKSGGGYVRAHKDAEVLSGVARNEKNEDVLANGNVIVTTAYFYGFVMNGSEKTLAVLGMTSTQLKKARQWLNTMMSIKFEANGKKFTPPMFSHSYYVSTVPESNEKGSWYGWKIEIGRRNDSQILIQDASNVAKKLATGERLSLPSPRNEDKPF